MSVENTLSVPVKLESAEKNRAENRELTLNNLEAYVKGCEEIAIRLHSTIEKVVESGKRPVILIPSRGAVPIFLLARPILNTLDHEASYLADRNARYYPNGIFDYLEGKVQKEKSDELTTVDVLLYPFTADVSLEKRADDKLARRLRESCAR